MEENKIPTAQNELEELLFRLEKCLPDSVAVNCIKTINYALELMQKEKIEFAKMHVKATLEAVCESGQIRSVFADKDLYDTINNCYPLENIK